jgi:hypothetical protein
LVIGVAVAFVLNRRARRALGPEPATVTELALADVLDETLDDLRGEQDPRLAVIASYARLERVLGAVGLPRREAEAPEEYLDRILAAVVVSPRGARRLTDLYTWARFSGHDVRPGMKEEAIDTLEQVRDELRAAEAWRNAAAPPTVATA